jgi:hypothetical protein
MSHNVAQLKAVLLLSASLFGSFFITLWLTAPPDLPLVLRADTLETITARNNNDVINKLAAAGLHSDEAIIGKIDQFDKQTNESLRVAGWALDRSGDGSPLIVAIYVDGKARLTVNTKGPHAEVTKAFNLPDKLISNVSFSGTFNCAAADGMTLVISPSDGRFTRLNPLRCP